MRDPLAGVRPGVEHLVVALALGDDAALIELVDLEHALLGVADDPRLAGRSDQVVGGERQAAAGALAEADAVHVVQQVDRRPAAQDLVAVGDHFGQFAGPHRDVVERHAVGQHHVEHHAADGGVDERAGLGVSGCRSSGGASAGSLTLMRACVSISPSE